MTIHKPSWFSEDLVMVSTAPTCGLTKGGRLLPKVDRSTGRRVLVTDPETGEETLAIDDRLIEDVTALIEGRDTETLRFVRASDVSLRNAVPTYFDDRFDKEFDHALKDDPTFAGFTSMTIGEMVEEDLVTIRGGHGSPSKEMRVGTVPYIKVSDLRAGTVNINPTNRVPESVARQFWGGPSSGLQPFDLVCPERTSKNIGDFCVLMPGQEQVVMTKEMIVVRAGKAATFDSFYLLWALTLNIVRAQWHRVVFMQTNREDVGDRFLEIRVPVAPDVATATAVSNPFRDYYGTMAKAREAFTGYLTDSANHHFYVTGAEPIDDLEDEAVEIAVADEDAAADPTVTGTPGIPLQA